MLNDPARDDLVSGSAPAAEAARQALYGLIERRVPQRILARDHTVWRPEPREIADRLGWLDAGAFLIPHLPELQAFVAQIRNEGYRDVVLLGMGGSCLGPEVLRRALGRIEGFPSLSVLDSTVPGRVAAVAGAIDPTHTLFIVSSKSGGTTETLSFLQVLSGAWSKTPLALAKLVETSSPLPMRGRRSSVWPQKLTSVPFT